MTSVGATVTPSGVVYRTWAPDRRRVQVAIGGKGASERRLDLRREKAGYFSVRDRAGRAGDSYEYMLDGEVAVPDIASRYQPRGVFRPSCVIDPRAYAWKHPHWRRPRFRGRVIYELHLGTFTQAGTFRAAAERLDYLANLGINTIEIMPVADFPGRWNWGYDGVMLFAPARCYGHPDDFRALIDAAHGRGLAVVLDVVYNHLGPAGNHFARYTPRYFHRSRDNPWGQSLNLDGVDARPVRNFFIQNARYWLDEFRLDGLRLDATHAMPDRSRRHLGAEIAATVRARGGFVIAEDERNRAAIVSRGSRGDWGADAVWADDFHHSIHVALTGRRESYFGSYAGTPRERADILKHGWKYRGQYFPHWGRRRGTPCRRIPPERFVIGITNHDQVGNRPQGDRINQRTAAAAYRAASMLFCLSPYTPMLFMGQEWSASTPFLFFTDQPGDLGDKIAEGRRREFAALRARGGAGAESFPHPQAESTFQSSKLRWPEKDAAAHRAVLALYETCLRLRSAEAIFQNPPRKAWSVKKIGEWVALRWTSGASGGDWLLLTCLARGAPLDGRANFLAPRPRRRWRSVLFSNDRRFGGDRRSPATLPPGATPLRGAIGWLLREHSGDSLPCP